MEKPVIKLPSLKQCICWVQDSAGLLALLTLILLMASVHLEFGIESSKGSEGEILISHYIAFALLFFSILIFTRPLNSSSKETVAGLQDDASITADNSRFNVILRFAYLFIALVTSASLSILFLLEEPIVISSKKNDSQPNQAFYYISSPLAVLPGCDFGSRSGDSGKLKDALTQFLSDNPDIDKDRVKVQLDAMPDGAFCGDLPPQWVVSIGGNIMLCHISGDCFSQYLGKQKFNSSSNGEQGGYSSLEQALTGTASALNDRKNSIAQYKKCLDQIGDSLTVLNVDPTNPVSLPQSCVACPDCADKNKKQFFAAQATALKTKINEAQAEWNTLNREYTQLQQTSKKSEKMVNFLPGQPVVGGIIVPLYFFILSIAGALISMIRRVPEYQRRATQQYKDNFEKKIKENVELAPPITAPEAREYILFQILQVISAPVIAILVYSYSKPENMAAGVLLAFVAGFSSEVVLVAVRKSVDGLLGAGLRDSRIRVGVMQNMLHEKKENEPEATPTPQADSFASGENVTLIKGIAGLDVGTQLAIRKSLGGDSYEAKVLDNETGEEKLITLQGDQIKKSDDQPKG
ncbi:hypothetical protein [Teredinibacter sp. KSP-S5-2]|uniref:hypothetical protein n=1 Tax=Teredinibacter sp. KSP-S5-2 TaxID=3034506 RepID=UPI002934B475|nr:hypothetical protein [Teredinibacter sp. KSP-S5-2]WNO11520.1 hypothetical protein P5V12_10080 [Teredinibacter sp. KSP-S5-2]